MADNLAKGLTSEGTYAPDKLLAGEYPRVVKAVTILTGQNVLRGALLGKITASGKYILSLSAAVDGSQTPDAVLLEDCDATAADKTGLVFLTGEFNEDALILGAAHTIASVRDGLRQRGIFLHKITSN
jgi:hypothetical protein